MTFGSVLSCPDALVGESPAWQRARTQIEQVAPTTSTVLIQGETGTGKELVARAIHARSARRDRALIAINCAALPRDLVESELFGHERGAFTGAVQQRRGRFEQADGGTLFLDEIGELPLEMQGKLLRVLQQREFQRIGANRDLHTDVRVVAATNRDLRADVAAGRFRADLFFRLDVFPIHLPPLRDRRDDIPLLIRHIAGRTARRLGRSPLAITPDFIAWAMTHDWPGNVRELENVIERALIMAGDGLVTQPAEHSCAGVFRLGSDRPGLPSLPGITLDAIAASHMLRVLDVTRWQIEGDRGAARVLGLNPSTLRGRMRKLGLRKPA